MLDTKKLDDAISAAEPGADSIVALVNALRDAINNDPAVDAAAQVAVDAAADRIIAMSGKIADAVAAPAMPAPVDPVV